MPKYTIEKDRIYRVFTEKKAGFDVHARSFKNEINELLKLNVSDVREFLRYDAEGMTKADFDAALFTVFSEPQVDNCYQNKLPDLTGYEVFAVEYLPGQYDQRADSCMQCVQLVTVKERPLIKCAKVYAVKGVSEKQLLSVKRYVINPVESREADMEMPETLKVKTAPPEKTPVISGFIKMDSAQLAVYYKSMGFAMSLSDLIFVQDYFKGEGRDPFLTELKVLDTYWSDHCRHTTFTTELSGVTIGGGNPHIKDAYALYNTLRGELYAGRDDKYPCLMDIATIAMKKLKKDGRLADLDESEEINACSIKVKAKVNGKDEDWLVMFKNETHNHPTEIEPFGGAATCLGGAIRDPLSGRSYVYQAMRITGAADPTVPLESTIKGKLPQRILTKTAAAGFSSYGNQIGLCTGIVREFYHPGFTAKRLETGFVIGAAPAGNVVRTVPAAGDQIILLGGDTGRDGCGGATGSSKSHTADSVDECGAEVQKGNPLTERNIQRLFRNPEATKLIKRCNDFGAGGVCVAVGELADGLDIDLSAVPKKYEGLTATELAISESQERMAVVVRREDADTFITLAARENLKATVVAAVTGNNRMVMKYNGETVLDIKRSMLNSAGVRQFAAAEIAETMPEGFDSPDSDIAAELKKGGIKAALLSSLKKLNVCSQKGLIEIFDSSIGGASVLAPLGGRNQLTPSSVMAAKLPAGEGTETATVCSYGYDPDLMSADAFTGAVYSVLTSIEKVAVSGVAPEKIYLTLQEYFKRLGNDPKRWGQPAAALLGAMYTQLKTGIGAIGGKDSMSGTFEKLDVPPTLISFAVGTADAGKIISNVFDRPGRKVWLLKLKRDKYQMPDFAYVNKLLSDVYAAVSKGKITAAAVVEQGGAAPAVIKSCFGNGLGFSFGTEVPAEELFLRIPGDIIVAADEISSLAAFAPLYLGETSAADKDSAKYLSAFCGTLEPVFRTAASADKGEGVRIVTSDAPTRAPAIFRKTPAPRVLLPVFPGTNGEYDMAEKFKAAGAEPHIYVIKNQSAADIEESVKGIIHEIVSSQIIVFSGGFSGGDEPDGSGKFIAATFRNPGIADAVNKFLTIRKGLILGVCNGFQALVKMGLLPYGHIKASRPGDATLTFNTINRHIAHVCEIRVASVMSPWFAAVRPGDRFLVPISHGEGRFICGTDDLRRMEAAGQIATQYIGADGLAYCGDPANPNGSVMAIEGITDMTGQILGKMGHTERAGSGLFKNIPGSYDMKLFESGVKYFK